jgi:membrane protein implicated in regulation of membrane protease activity
MFFRRGVSDDDPWLQPKLWLFSVGAILALVGMATEAAWVIGLAGLVLAIGVLLRFVPRRSATRSGREEKGIERKDEGGGGGTPASG